MNLACSIQQHFKSDGVLMSQKIFPILPQHPERVCWGCDLYCNAHSMRCGNGTERTQHPLELLGTNWQQDWSVQRSALTPESKPDSTSLSSKPEMIQLKLNS